MNRSSQLWLCAAVSLLVLVPRSILIDRAHSPCVDADEHLGQGLAWLRREHHPQAFYDPPLGKMILALPLYFAGARFEFTTIDAGSHASLPARRTVLYQQNYAPETLTSLVATWKALLFVPCVLVIFLWCREVYGTCSAWLAATIVLIDPTIAAHVSVAALDSVAIEGVVIASYLAWRAIRHPTLGRIAAASVATGAAMLIKHTALLLPPAFMLLALLEWFVRPRLISTDSTIHAAPLRARVNSMGTALLITCGSIWALTLFDFSPPAQFRDISGIDYASGPSVQGAVLEPAMSNRWPAGVYLSSIVAAMEHTSGGHTGYLWGEMREHGWRYYFAAVALYKVPIGILLVFALGTGSIWFVRPRWDELSILLPMLACAALLMITGYNVGFRHALPTYVLLIMLASRCVVGSSRLVRFTAWTAVSAAAVHSLTFHPDYLAYTNGWSKKPYLAISDSNLDWGQAMKQVGAWLDANPARNQAIWLDVFNDIRDPAIDRYVRGRAHRIFPEDAAPTEGVLIVSPARIVGIYSSSERYAWLRNLEPIEVIGHTMLVYDLNRTPPTTSPSKSGK